MTTGIEPLPRSADHRVTPLTAAVIAIVLSVTAGAIGYGLGSRTPIPVAPSSSSGLFQVITAAGPGYVIGNAQCQEKQLAKHPDGRMGGTWTTLTVREFCEAMAFNFVLKMWSEKD